MKKKNRLFYDFPYYLIGVIISVLIWYLGFNLKFSPKSYESLYIFYGGSIKDYSLSTKIQKEANIEGLINCEIVSSNPSDSSFDTKYNVVCFNNSDLAILPQSVLEKTDCKSVYEELEENYGLSFYTQNDKNYGLIINENLKEKLGKYFIFENYDYAICLVSSSVNYGEMTNNAIVLLEWIVNYENF